MIHRPDEASKHCSDKIQSMLIKNGYIYDSINPQLVIVIGGDGTFLYAVQQYQSKLENVVFYTIHTGTLGFFADYHDLEWDCFLKQLLNHQLNVQEYPLLCIDDGLNRYYGVNEVRIENVVRTQVLDVYINGSYFETLHGSGVCVCTQLGSTAYNRSLGGAIIQEGLPAIEMIEIASIHHRKFQSLGTPLILKMDTKIVLKAERLEGAILGADANVFNLQDQKEILIEVADKKVRVLRHTPVSYFEKLKTLF